MYLTASLKTGDVAYCNSSLTFVRTYTLEITLRFTNTSGQSKFTHNYNSYSYLVYTTVNFITQSCDIFMQASTCIVFALFTESIVT